MCRVDAVRAVKAHGASAATPKLAGCSDAPVFGGSTDSRGRPASRRLDRKHVVRRGFRGEPRRQRVSPETPHRGRAGTRARVRRSGDADVQESRNRVRSHRLDPPARRDPRRDVRSRRARARPGVRHARATGPCAQEDRRRKWGRPDNRVAPPGQGTPREARLRRRRVQAQPGSVADGRRTRRGVGAMATQVRPRGQRGGHLGGAPGESRATARRNGKKERRFHPTLPRREPANESAPILASTETADRRSPNKPQPLPTRDRPSSRTQSPRRTSPPPRP